LNKTSPQPLSKREGLENTQFNQSAFFGLEKILMLIFIRHYSVAHGLLDGSGMPGEALCRTCSGQPEPLLMRVIWPKAPN